MFCLNKKLCSLLFFINVITYSSAQSSQNESALFDVAWTANVHAPKTITQLQELIKDANTTNKKICIVGAGKSQGGQTMGSEDSIRISLQNFNKLLHLDQKNKQVTVQTGMTWCELQKLIAPHRLAAKSMQSYNDFSIGGSLSVNVHGRDFHAGPLINTVKSFKLLNANGELLTVSRTENKELFGLAIGGYGLFGIIVEVTLELTDDILMKSNTVMIKSSELADYFLKNIKNNPNITFYSARYILQSSDMLDHALVVTHEKTDENASSYFKFNPDGFSTRIFNTVLRGFFSLTRKYQTIKNLRFFLEKYYFSGSKTISRNNFMGYSINSLPQDTSDTRYILQEYFIPYDKLTEFVAHMKTLIKDYNINLINLTARHVHKDNESYLSFSPQESCALVLYLNVPKNKTAYEKTIKWTRNLIDKALAYGGSYYLPYQLLGTQEQLETAYPMFKEFIALKKTYDPKEIFTNSLYQKYSK